MKKLTLFLMALLFAITSKAEVTATWSIEEGATIAAFTEVKVTFSGVDSVGRKIDGVEVTGVVSSTSSVNILHTLNEDGTVKSSTTMSNARNGLSVTYSPKTALTDGNYRIALPAGVITFNPRRKDANGTSLPVVKNAEEFVLNFTISSNAGGGEQEEEVQTDTATVTTMADVITALGTKSKVVVLFKNLKPITKASSSGYYDDYMPDGTTKLNMGGYTIPADFDCYGTYVADDNKFTVDTIVGLHAFANLYLLKNYYETNKSDANVLAPLNITDPVVVTGVDGNNVFVQYAYARAGSSMYNEHFVIEGNHTLKVGDQIASFTAQYKKSTSLTLDEENTALVRNAYFAVPATSLGAITADNAIKYASLSSINNIASKAANAVQLPAGGIIVKENSKYFYTIGTDSLEIRPATGVEIESFVGKELNLSIRGIVDYCNTADYANAFIANSIKEINTNYETISQWLRATVEGDGTGSLKNPVVVTHSEYKNYKQYIFIGDETGGLCLISNDKIDSIKTGHVLTGVAGKLDFSDTKKTPQLSVPSNIQVVDSNKTIAPVEVTIAELLEEENNAINNGRAAIKYANRLVKIKNVVKGTKWIGNNARVYPLIQGEDTLAYATNTLNAYHTQFSTTTPMWLTGIIDFRCINSSNLYSIYPRSIDDLNEQPTINPAPGTYYAKELELTITCEDPSKTAILYSFDPEVDPTVDGELYEGPIKITQDTTIWYAVEYGDRISKLYEASYQFKTPEITATWNIENNATIEYFTEATITFAGIDSVGRKLDGVEVQKAVAQGSSTNVLFYSVAADGTRTPVAGGNGLMYAKTNNLAITYSLANKGYDLVEDKFMPKGNYCIVIDAGDVLFTPNRKDANGSQPANLKVYNDKEYVLYFTIENDYVEKVDPVQIDAAFTANPADNSSLKEISEVVLTFTDKTAVTVGELGATPRADVWPFLNQVTTGSNDEEFGGSITNVSQPVAPMYSEVVENKPNAIRFYIASDLLEGVKSINTPGSYTLTIPAGVVVFSETEINKPITLNYTVTGTGVNIDIVTTENIYTYNGTIMADSDIQIFTITGQNVTDMNGNLQNGVYVVKTANATTKVVIK
ncbi:MAG: chitobiase/beta-hexosaminidase C-terminal domain-containing protein [Paludibacteraceae bacterium]|nr:chitobiase/beta-hexosaminidase C-terminal domain-containing protein [Paludibacteraceae bacterium]